MINKCQSRACSRYMGQSSMRGLPCCEKYPNGIPHVKIMGIDTCPYYEREKQNPGPETVKGEQHGR